MHGGDSSGPWGLHGRVRHLEHCAWPHYLLSVRVQRWLNKPHPPVKVMGLPLPCLSSAVSWHSGVWLPPCNRPVRFCSLQPAVLYSIFLCSPNLYQGILHQPHKHVFRELVVVTAWLICMSCTCASCSMLLLFSSSLVQPLSPSLVW